MKDPRSWVCLFISFWAAIVLGILFGGCEFEDGAVSGGDNVTAICRMHEVQDPIRGRAPLVTYNGRGFLSDNVHLGWDINLPEGEPIYPIGCGVVRVARAAQGYGTFVVVIEHQLSSPMRVVTGDGFVEYTDQFLSIYGHLRPTLDRAGRTGRLSVYPGKIVSPSTVIGYVQHRDLNGDGNEHLHLGIRLQTSADAMITDPRAWFRGYDTTPTMRGWFSDPQDVLRSLQGQFRSASTPTYAAFESSEYRYFPE